MGIKFHCPNGHKMNVKSFLAGKKGKCPKCGVGVDIPLESQGASRPSERAAKSTTAAEPVAAAAFGIVVDVPARETATSAEAVGNAIESAGQSPGVDEAPSIVESAASPPAESAPRGPATSANDLPAVIAEDPQAQWYMCTQSGERFGPVGGKAVQKWLGEGRIAADSLVWREGWAEWQTAARVFPSLQPASPLAGLDGGSPSAAPAAEQPKMDDLLADALAGATTSATTYVARSQRRSGKDKMVLTSMVLIGAVTVLAVVLLLVVLNQ